MNRSMLDFDFERLCSVSLSNINVYACLVCGKYFQGRGKSSPAYAHSIHDDHHVFISLEKLKVRPVRSSGSIHHYLSSKSSSTRSTCYRMDTKSWTHLSTTSNISSLRPSSPLSSTNFRPAFSLRSIYRKTPTYPASSV